MLFRSTGRDGGGSTENSIPWREARDPAGADGAGEPSRRPPLPEEQSSVMQAAAELRLCSLVTLVARCAPLAME